MKPRLNSTTTNYACDGCGAAVSSATPHACDRPVFVCGTRRVVADATTVGVRGSPVAWRVVCATCGAGGAIAYASKDAAAHAAVARSTWPCRACGAS